MKNLRDFVLAGLLLAIGVVLHYITPSTGTPVKPDFLLAMLFLCLLCFEDVKVGFVAGLAAGVLSGLTTSVPGGFLPNLIDKINYNSCIDSTYICFKEIDQHVYPLYCGAHCWDYNKRAGVSGCSNCVGSSSGRDVCRRFCNRCASRYSG
ncbi:MAG: hypothetical protein PWR01_1316 [Clostridiales bacterium]|nr:hypothetical protein [Clostridiales bacterium]